MNEQKKQRKPGSGLHDKGGAKPKTDTRRITVSISFDKDDLEWLDAQPGRRNATARLAVKRLKDQTP